MQVCKYAIYKYVTRVGKGLPLDSLMTDHLNSAVARLLIDLVNSKTLVIFISLYVFGGD